jgi:hypothetical protein
VPQVVIPDNTSTASNQISRGDRARDVNREYRDFLEYHHTAAVPTRAVRPRDKGHVEAGVKIVTNWVIGRLADRRFASLADLNEAIAAAVEAINDRTPFRGQKVSRRQLFEEHEKSELIVLPETRWQPVTWKKAKVNRDYHLQSSDLWSRAYFVRQAHKVSPNTVTAICNVLDRQRIEAQGYRSCQNILALARGDNKALLERACGQLIDETSPRAISYTAVKQHLAALRTHHDGGALDEAGATAAGAARHYRGASGRRRAVQPRRPHRQCQRLR